MIRTFVRPWQPWQQRSGTIGPRKQHRERQQVGRDRDLYTAINLVEDKMMINNAINCISTAFKKIKNKVEKKVKEVLDTGIDNYVINKGLKWLEKDLIKNMSNGICNFEIGKAIKEINNEDINESFLGEFPLIR